MKKRIALILITLIMASVMSGCCISHDWENATCEKPITCAKCGKTTGEALGHDWMPPTCTAPKTCKRCNTTTGIEIGHDWTGTTCTEPNICRMCGKYGNAAHGHSYWTEKSYDTPRVCVLCKEMEPLELPRNGQVFIGQGEYCESSLTIRSSTTQSCYIKLKDASGRDIFSFFVAAGSTAEVAVPGGNYYVYFAYGDEWYGTEHIFGPETAYAKDDEICDFWSYTWEYDLYPTYGGNFSETPISAEEF